MSTVLTTEIVMFSAQFYTFQKILLSLLLSFSNLNIIVKRKSQMAFSFFEFDFS